MRSILAVPFLVVLAAFPALAQSKIEDQARKVNELRDALWVLKTESLDDVARNNPEQFAEAMKGLEEQVEATENDLMDKMRGNKCSKSGCPGHAKSADACSNWVLWSHDSAGSLQDQRSNRHSRLEKARQMFAAAKNAAKSGNGSSALTYYDLGKNVQDLDNFLVTVPGILNSGLILTPPTGIGGAIKGAKVLKALSDLNSAAVDGIRKDVEKQLAAEEKALKKMLKNQGQDASAKGMNKMLEDVKKAQSNE